MACICNDIGVSMSFKIYLSGGAPSKNAILLPCVSCRNLFSAINIPAYEPIVSKAYHFILSLSHTMEFECAPSCPTETVHGADVKTTEIKAFIDGCGWLRAIDVREGNNDIYGEQYTTSTLTKWLHACLRLHQ